MTTPDIHKSAVKYDENGWPVLILAVRLKAERSALEILKAGADVNVRDRDGNTPLASLAWPPVCKGVSEKGRLDIARLLLEFGADPSINNHKGQSTFDLAQIHNSRCLKDFLRDHRHPRSIKEVKSKAMSREVEGLDLGGKEKHGDDRD